MAVRPLRAVSAFRTIQLDGVLGRQAFTFRAFGASKALMQLSRSMSFPLKRLSIDHAGSTGLKAGINEIVVQISKATDFLWKATQCLVFPWPFSSDTLLAKYLITHQS